MGEIAVKNAPIFGLISLASLIVCVVSPYIFLTIPVLVTVACAAVSLFRKEKFKALPIIALIGVGLVFYSAYSQFNPVAPSNAKRYGSATWQYSSSIDEMRGTTSRSAQLFSPTEINFEFPYNGDNAAYITIMNREYVILSVSKGQFVCSYEDTVSVKFDDGPIFQYPCKSDPDGKSERILIMPDYTSPEEQPSNPIDGIIKAKVMTVEAKFYEYGARQILFNVAGLDEAKI